jgi:lipoyl-dependent peroxiredoxin
MIVEKLVYTARTHTSGGREGGMSRSSDGHLDVKTSVDAEVDLGIAQGGYVLQARLNVRLPGVEPQAAQALAAAAHLICPYSKATHGNINVETQVSTEA